MKDQVHGIFFPNENNVNKICFQNPQTTQVSYGCTYCQLIMIPVSRDASCMYCQLHVLPVAHVAICTCCQLHMLPIANLSNLNKKIYETKIIQEIKYRNLSTAENTQ